MVRLRCPLCGSRAQFDSGYKGYDFCICTECHIYLYNENDLYNYDKHKLKSYFHYHKKEWRVFFLNNYLNIDFKDLYAHGFDNVLFLSANDVENWYPKSFEEKIDYIMIYLSDKASYIGETFSLTYSELIRVYFIDDCDLDKNQSVSKRYDEQICYINDFLSSMKYCNIINLGSVSEKKWTHEVSFQITPQGYARIYELQKNLINNKKAFIAMQFGRNSEKLRRKIKEGIRLAGYEPRIMDEIEHNHQIVPEMLYEIKNSKFIVAELSYHNNGAYYEAGYALGLGKEVIHICKKDALQSGLHFDVAQVNTIVYDNINELPDKIVKRIKATIGKQ